MTHKLGHNLVMVWQSIQVTSLKDWIGWGARDNKRVCCEAALTQAFPFDILKKKEEKNSITLGKNSRFLQLLMYCFQNSYILITFALYWHVFANER